MPDHWGGIMMAPAGKLPASVPAGEWSHGVVETANTRRRERVGVPSLDEPTRCADAQSQGAQMLTHPTATPPLHTAAAGPVISVQTDHL